jgi:hypothetical protein
MTPTPAQAPARPAGADALLAAIESVDPQRVARWRYWSHAKRCWTGGDIRLCERCRQLDADASAEDWRRSQKEATTDTTTTAGNADAEPGATSDPTPTASAGRLETGRDVTGRHRRAAARRPRRT